MTGLATVVAVQDKENVGYSGKTVFKQTDYSPRRVLGNRSNLTLAGRGCASKAMPAATKHTPQVATSEVLEVKQLTAHAWQVIMQWGACLTHHICCDADTHRTSVCSAPNQLGGASAAVPAEVCSLISRAGSTLDSSCAQGCAPA